MSDFNDFMNKAGAFASKAAGKAKDLAVDAYTKTKQLSRVAKLNMDISGQRDTIRKAYTELGKLYYAAHHEDPESDLAPLCQQIDDANATIATLEEEIAAIKETMTADEKAAVDADFASVVDSTEADVEVEIREEPPAAEEPPVNEEAPAAEEPIAVEEPAVVEEPIPAEEPAAAEEPIPAEEPTTVEEPIPAEEPAVVEEPIPAEEPTTAEEPIAVEEPTVAEEPIPAEEPAPQEEPHEGDWT